MNKHFIYSSSARPLATSSFSLLIDIFSPAMPSCFRNSFFTSVICFVLIFVSSPPPKGTSRIVCTDVAEIGSCLSGEMPNFIEMMSR
uniref:Uncharacterized protein n=1 Tax=Arundo donax TaxID=35708 RepID=A0A0A8Y4I4_ARUDO